MVEEVTVERLPGDSGDEPQRSRQCYISDSVAASLGKEAGDHLRIEAEYLAAYAEIEDVVSADQATVWLPDAGCDRVGARREDTVHVSATVPVEGGYMAAWPRGDFAETLWGDETGRLLISCPHGGDIEFGTDDIGARLFRSLRVNGYPVTAWLCHGFHSGFGSDAFSRWHIKKPVTAANAYPELNKMQDWVFDYVVGIHLHNNRYVAVGGRAATDLRERVAAELREALPADYEVRTDYDNMSLTGRAATSSVNYFCDGTGVQIELPPFVCYKYRRRVADALHEVYTFLLK